MNRPEPIASSPAVSPLDDAVLERFRVRARIEDRDPETIAASIQLLRDTGRLGLCRQDARTIFQDLVRLAEVNLSLARLYEGHVNALTLIDVHGDKSLRAKARAYAETGELFGVWGADDGAPLRLAQGVLSGGKTFASGLGSVTRAVITVQSDEGGRLALAPVADPARQDPARWRMTGMKASRSGAYDFTGEEVSALSVFGDPDCYPREPWFVGGVWRIAAVQAGGASGLLKAAAEDLRLRGRIDADAQIARLGAASIGVLSAFGLAERAASFSETRTARRDPERAVALSAAARLHAERVGLDAVGEVERSVGLAHFADDSETGRIARDLSVYMRQAAGDAFLQRAGKYLTSRGGALSGAWFG